MAEYKSLDSSSLFKENSGSRIGIELFGRKKVSAPTFYCSSFDKQRIISEDL